MDEDVVVIHTDGGCRPNPGPGGWGAVLRQRQHVREMCGGEPGQTSNNRMELTAPIMALEALARRELKLLIDDRLALEQVNEAFERLAARTVRGKLLLDLNGP